MTTYRGPHVEVKQEFQTSPGAVAIESLPPSIFGTAYDVYEKENLGTMNGLIENLAWPEDATAPVRNRQIAGFRAFEFYPPKAYADTQFGYIDLEKEEDDFTADGVTLTTTEAYIIPGTEKEAGASTAIIPMYNKATTVQINAADLRTVVITGGTVVTAKIKPGQSVWVLEGTWKEVGKVASIGADETKIKLAVPYSATVTGTQIIVGVEDPVVAYDLPNLFYDAGADFISARVRPGDYIELSSLSISGSVDTPVKATIAAVIDKNTLRMNTVAPTTRAEEFLKYYNFNSSMSATANVYSYAIKRYVGFSQNYGFSLLNSNAGITISDVNGTQTQFTYPDTVAPIMTAGDVIQITGTTVVAASNVHWYEVDSITHDTGKYTVNATETMIRSGTTATTIADGNYLHGWNPKIKTDVVVDFRSIRGEEEGVVKRIGSVQDIQDAWTKDGIIDPRNELAFMALAAFTASGQRVCYGVNVDADLDNMATSYAEAIEAMSLIDCYSTVFGTCDGSINSLMPAYVNGQSDPYEGHERVGILTYDERDVFLQGVDTGSTDDAGLVTIDGSFNPITAGVTVNDTVEVYDADGALLDTLTVTETPSVATEVQTDGDTEYSDSGTNFRFMCGRKDAQALMIAALGGGERRVKVIWPGWFSAQVSGEALTLPPYYIAAARAGYDCGIIASQSMTNYDIALPGISNIELGTNFNYRKAQLDEIGGGGIDIQIADVRISQTVKSRHDLTSNMDAVELREWSITKQADVAAKTIRNAVAPYIGKYNITNSLIAFLYKVCAIVCTKLVKDSILASIVVKNISRDDVIADKINFSIEATVFVAGNYYDITLYVKSR